MCEARWSPDGWMPEQASWPQRAAAPPPSPDDDGCASCPWHAVHPSAPCIYSGRPAGCLGNCIRGQHSCLHGGATSQHHTVKSSVGEGCCKTLERHRENPTPPHPPHWKVRVTVRAGAPVLAQGRGEEAGGQQASAAGYRTCWGAKIGWGRGGRSAAPGNGSVDNSVRGVQERQRREGEQREERGGTGQAVPPLPGGGRVSTQGRQPGGGQKAIRRRRGSDQRA